MPKDAFFDWSFLWGTLCADGRKVHIESVINNTLSEKFIGHSGCIQVAMVRKIQFLINSKKCIRLAKLTIQ